jgi:hypothetical protein
MLDSAPGASYITLRPQTALQMNGSQMNYFAFTYRFSFGRRTGEMRVRAGVKT